jgi:HK97 family phage prohead protease
MMKKIERRFEVELRAMRDEDNGNYIVGVPIVFDRQTDLGYYTEVIDRHALDNTDMKDVRFLVNHNTDMIPLARSRNNNANSTMQMWVEEDGMHIRVNLDVERNSEAKSLYSAVDRGDVSGMSFMFSVDEDSWEGLDTEMPKRTINSIGKIFEVSAVTFPAYEQTSIQAADLSEALENAKDVLESAKRSAEDEAKRTEIRNLLRGNANED